MNIRRLVLLGQKTVEGYTRDNCGQMAAGISYHILFSIVPLAMFLVSVLAMVVGSDTVQRRLTDALSEQLEFSTASVTLELTSSGEEYVESTYGAEQLVDLESELEALNSDDEQKQERSSLANSLLSGEAIEIAGVSLLDEHIEIHFDNLVLETIKGVVQASSTAGVISFLVLGFTASGLFGVVRRSLDVIWRVPQRLPFVTGKLLDVAMVFVLLALLLLTLAILFLLSVASSLFLQPLIEMRGDMLWLENLLWSVVSVALPTLFSFVLFLVLYRYGPHARNRIRDVWLGALLAAIGFEVLKFGFGLYIRYFSTFDVVYGALGGVLLFLFFVFLSAQLFLFCAEVAAAYPRVMRGDFDNEPPAPGPPMTLRDRAVALVRGLFLPRRMST